MSDSLARSSAAQLQDQGDARRESDASTGIDALSDVLRSVRLTGSLLFLVDATSPWVTEAPPGSSFASVLLPEVQHVVSYHIIVDGRCWGGLVGEPSTCFEAGDILVVPHGDAYGLSSAPGMRASWSTDEAVAFFREMSRGRLPAIVNQRGGESEHTRFIRGFLGCDLRPFNPVLTALPRMIHLKRSTQHESRLDYLIEFTRGELQEAASGMQCVLLRLSELLFVEVIRRYLQSLPAGEQGWVSALRDPVVGHALTLIHNQVAYPWTADKLTAQVGLSRSAFSERFRYLVGQPPMQYVTRWRMQLAGHLLRESAAKVSAIGLEVGYDSEAAFSRAFKKTTGTSPSLWRQHTSSL
ncbi:MAG TPA: AraC family transcriptional regulator [Burkholderiales bacterium]|nr:AraC family transcriptional regulator [Burkholderiales bacterium]